MGFALPASAQTAASGPSPPAGSPAPEATEALESDEQNLAKQLANPVASLVSVPFQFNYDGRLNTLEGGWRANLNIQPVIPFSLNSDWNLISRTILPLIYSGDAVVDSGRIFGTGDTLQSFFFSPVEPWNGVIWGAGPAFLLPTGSSAVYSVRQWGAGPTAVVLDQIGPWTIGVLANHVWSFAQSGYPAPDVSSTFIQPFVSYTTSDAWTFTLNTESTYDWVARKWQIPLNAVVSKVVKVGPQLMSFGVGARYYAVSPNVAAKGWGARAIVTFLFPK
ncbi:transporter [Methylocella sp.]|uniref:transporter n=1 Tax=Methylocella sp. TaxID=1978226 RepID=UPI0037841763